MNNLKILLIVYLLLFAITNQTFSQDAKLLPNSSMKKNQIAITTSVYNFFDGSPTLQIEYMGIRKGWYGSSYGIEYIRNVDSTNSILFSANYLGIDYFDNMNNGEICGRRISKFSINYLRNINVCNVINTYLIGGVDYRYGQETHYSFSNELKDIGISLGVYLKKSIYKNINIITNVKYTYYVYTYDKVYPIFRSENSIYSIGDGSTKHQLSITFVIAYAF